MVELIEVEPIEWGVATLIPGFHPVEIAGEVTARFDVLKGKQARWPVTELADRWVAHATAEEFPAALELVSLQAGARLRHDRALLDSEARRDAAAVQAVARSTL